MSRAPRAAVRVGVVPLFGAAAPAPSAARRQGVLAGQAIGRGDGHRARAVRPRVARRAVRARRVAPQDAPRRVAVAAGVWLRRPRPRRGGGAAARVLGLRRGVRVEAPACTRRHAPRASHAVQPEGAPGGGPAVPRGLARPGAEAAAERQPPSARRAAPSSDPSSPPRPLPIFALASRCAASPLDLDSMGSPTPCCPAGARAPLDSHHASVRYRRNNYRSPPSPGARRRGYFIIIPLPRAAAGRRAPGPARDGFCGASKVGGVRVPRSSLKGGWIGSP